MNYTNKNNLPQVLVDVLTKDFYDYIPDENEYTASELINPPKITILKRRHRDEMTVDVSDLFYRVWGNLMHQWLQSFSENESLKEERLKVEIGGYIVSGKPDLYFNKILDDYKLTSIWTYIYKSRMNEWTQQLNVYAYLLQDAGFPPEKLEILAMFRDWTKSKKEHTKGCPNQSETIEIPLWDPKDTEDWIAQRLQALAIAERLNDDEIPPCSEKDRWQTETVYAVMKEGRKSSVKNCETEREAEALVTEKGNGYSVQPRPGICKRCCPEYCDVTPFCNFYKTLIKKEA